MDKEDYGEFIDPEQSASIRKATTFKEIVMLQLKRISEIGSKQLRKGYVEKKIIQGQVVEKYHEDTRESYCNAIDMLFDLMVGECEKDKIFMKAYSELEKEESESVDQYNAIQDSEQRLNKWLNHKTKLRRKLLRELSRLLHETDFLASTSYTDG